MNCEKVHRAEVSTSRPAWQLPCSQDGLPGGEQIPVGERQGDVKEKKGPGYETVQGKLWELEKRRQG